MARDRELEDLGGFAKIRHSIWDDDDFLALTPEVRGLYFYITTRGHLNSAGITQINLMRWAEQLRLDVDQLCKYLEVLAEANFVAFDRRTNELLVRTYIYYDQFYAVGATCGKGIANNVRRIVSPDLRMLCLQQIVRLPAKYQAPFADLPEFPAALDHAGIQPRPVPAPNPAPNPVPEPAPAPAPTPVDEPVARGNCDESSDTTAVVDSLAQLSAAMNADNVTQIRKRRSTADRMTHVNAAAGQVIEAYRQATRERLNVDPPNASVHKVRSQVRTYLAQDRYTIEQLCQYVRGMVAAGAERRRAYDDLQLHITYAAAAAAGNVGNYTGKPAAELSTVSTAPMAERFEQQMARLANAGRGHG